MEFAKMALQWGKNAKFLSTNENAVRPGNGPNCEEALSFAASESAEAVRKRAGAGREKYFHRTHLSRATWHVTGK